jgi:vacuolar-type H+-ATPase subunit E/Vma4
LSVLELNTEIEKKATEEAFRILEDAREEAEKIIAEANAKTESLRNEKTKTLTRALDTEERAELAVARMDRKGEILQAKSDWANRVFEEAGKRLAETSAKGSAEYHEFLGKLILEGIAKMRGNRFIVEANSRDVEAIRREIKAISEKATKMKNERIDLQLKTQPTISLGGIIVSTEDKTQYYNSTLEARLSHAQQNLTGEVHKIIFKTGEQIE